MTKNQTLYLECYSGISGDMTVAALLDLGADQSVLLEGLKSLNVEGYQIKIGRRTKNSIDACDFDVILEYPEDHEHKHDHNHEHIHEQNYEQDHEHNHKHNYEHNHAHDNEHIQEHSHAHNQKTTHQDKHHHHDHSNQHDKSHHHSSPALAKYKNPNLVLGHHEHRNLIDINGIIDNSSISVRAKQLAKKIFLIIAEAEAKAHAKPLEEVHFHEVGAIDSIVDIVAAAICIDNLNITDVIVSELYEGMGQIMCQHGLLPIPVPAVANISSTHQLRLHITNVQGELVTPTGAAIAAALRTRESLPKDFHIHKIGLGAGKRNYSGASGILRAMLIKEPESSDFEIKNFVEELGNKSEDSNLSPSSISETNNSSTCTALSDSSTAPPSSSTTMSGSSTTMSGSSTTLLSSNILPGSSTALPSSVTALSTPSTALLHSSSMTNSTSIDKVWVLEANIDDCSGEALAFTMELLFDNGAKDVYYTPIFMKKNRPAYMIGIICIEEHIPAMERVLFTHTTTIGIRRHEAIRTVLPREIRTITTPHGEARVKICSYNNNIFYYPEYEDVKRLALSSGQDYLSTYELIKSLAKSSI